jgi:hypothetical protein
MRRLGCFLLIVLSFLAAPAKGQEALIEDPSEQLINRSYCAADLGEGRLAAGSTYGVLFYEVGDVTGTAKAPQRLEPEESKLLLADSVNDLAYADALLVVANGPAGLKLVRGTGAHEQPTVVSSIETPGAAMGVALSGPHLAVAMGVMGVALYSLADHHSPELLGTFDTDGYARQVRFIESNSSTELSLIVANGRGGVAELTIDPLAKFRVVHSNRIEERGDVRQVLPVPGGVAISRGKAGICLLPDVSRKAPFHCVDNLDVVRGLALAGDLLLAGDGGEGLLVVPGVNAWQPGESRRHKLSQGSINRVYVFGDKVVIAADYFGILVFPVATL